MTTVIEENRNLLRPALDVRCGFKETTDGPTSITGFGNKEEYAGIANIENDNAFPALMDLTGDGFLNDGRAVPMRTDIESYTYGIISNEPAREDGTFLSSFGVTIAATNQSSQVTLKVSHSDGASETIVFENVIWSSGKATFYIESWTPGELAYITGIYLGKYWVWGNDNLVSVNLDLRAVSTRLGGELEVSSIEIQVYEPNDYTDVIGFIPLGSPIWYEAGYPGDMSDTRSFYMSEPITWDNNILTIKGQDATMFLENTETAAKVGKSYGYTENGQNTGYVIAARIRDALTLVDFDEEGTLASIGAQSAAYWYFEEKAPRSIIAEFCDVFRDEQYLRLTYVDAGRPRLYINEAVPSEWTIYADEIAELNVQVEQNANAIKGTLVNYSHKASAKVTEQQATNGEEYLIELEFPASDAYSLPALDVEELITPTLFKIKAEATRTYEIYADQYKPTESTYTATDSTNGVTFDLENTRQNFPISFGSLTRLGMRDILDRSNILYTFTYRGNPHIQPRDIINVELATWSDELITIDGLYPDDELYPAADLYPYATYKSARKMRKEWVQMTVDNITLSHSDGGGFVSTITARKGAV